METKKRRICFKEQVLVAAVFFCLFSCKTNRESSGQISQEKSDIEAIGYRVIQSYPHDINAFTEGFLFYKGQLYESTGATDYLPQTRSLFGIVDLTTGQIEVKAEIDREKYFGEGIAFLGDKVYQLTYQSRIGFIYDASTFQKTGEFKLPGREGWGMTTDGTSLIMSDGTNTLYYLDPNTLQVVKTLPVTENGYAKDNLNELEMIGGNIYANIWNTNTIVRINPDNGAVTGIIDLTALATEARQLHAGSQEMNGIAYDSVSGKILITGKMWPKIYEIEFDI